MIKKVVFTGGACGGKSSIIQALRDEFKCVVSPEPAWIVFGLQKAFGLKFDTEDRQHLIFNLHVLFEYWAEESAKNNEIILMDRSIVDNSVFTKEEQYLSLMEKYKIPKDKIIDNYSVIIYCESIAHSKPEEFLLLRPFADVENTKKFDLTLLKVYKKCNNLIVLNENSLDKRICKTKNVLNNPNQVSSSMHELINQETINIIKEDSKRIMQKYNISKNIQENIISPILRSQENYLDNIFNL